MQIFDIINEQNVMVEENILKQLKTSNNWYQRYVLSEKKLKNKSDFTHSEYFHNLLKGIKDLLPNLDDKEIDKIEHDKCTKTTKKLKKCFLGELLDLKVFMVDGDEIKVKYNMDFVEGGNDLVYAFMPKEEIWVDAALEKHRMIHVIVHEMIERYLMLNLLYTYEKAHSIANQVEKYIIINLTYNNESEKEPKDYSWVRVDLPDNIIKRHQEFIKQIDDEDLFIKIDPTNQGIHGIETEPHITVKWGLNTQNPKDIRELLKFLETDNYTVSLDKVDIFENEEYDVLKINVESELLNKLNESLSTLKAKETFSEYKPHITLAYLKKGCGKKYKPNDFFKNLKFVCKEVVFEDVEDKETKIKI